MQWTGKGWAKQFTMSLNLKTVITEDPYYKPHQTPRNSHRSHHILKRINV